MIRIILVLLTLFSFLILGIPVLGLFWILKKFNPYLADLWSLRLVQLTFRWMLFLSGVQVTVLGEEHCPKDAALYIGNHRSFFDILITYSRCKDLTGFVAKEEMEKIPLLRIWMRRLYCLFLNRENPREGLKTILTAIEYVKSGISIFIFPEGTRNQGEEGSLLPFHAGSLKIAEKSGASIVPFVLSNTHAILEAQFPKIRPTKVTLEYLPPIDPSTLSPEKKKTLCRDLEELLRDTLKKHSL